MIRLKLPPVFARFTDQLSYDLAIEGGQVTDVLSVLRETAPDVGARLFDDRGAYRETLFRIGLNGAVADLASPVRSGDELRLIAATSGGAPTAGLGSDEIQRYARQLTLPDVGRRGQERLRGARVLLIGAGGLGCPVALYLAAAGVGALTLIDPDIVDLSNLQRQVLYQSIDVGRPKVEVAAERLIALNPFVHIETRVARLDADNAPGLIAAHDLVVDGSDDLKVRRLVNSVCRRLGKPWVFGSVYQFEGQVSVFPGTKDTPCYACLYPEEPDGDLAPNCASGGVLGVVPGLVGVVQATEALKWLLGAGEGLGGRLMLIDALAADVGTLAFGQRPDCPICAGRPEAVVQKAVAPKSGASAANVTGLAIEAAMRLARTSQVVVLDVREPGELELGALPGALNIPLGRLGQRAAELDPEDDYLVICRGGPRSRTAAGTLLGLGFRRVQWAEGGLLAWKDDAGGVILQG